MIKSIFRTLGLLIPLFVAWTIMIVVNESTRLLVNSNSELLKGEKIFTSEKFEDKCSWSCHNKTTDHCLKKHQGLSPEFRDIVNSPYFGIIEVLKSGSLGYRNNNIIYLVVLWPLFISMMIVSVYRNYRTIKSLS